MYSNELRVNFKRNLFAVSVCLWHKLHGSYEMRPPMVEEFGLPRADGNWTGTVGTLQHQQADFSLILSPTSERLPVVDFSRVYTPVSVCIVTLKPGSLPQYFQLVRPFTGKWTTTVGMLINQASTKLKFPHTQLGFSWIFVYEVIVIRQLKNVSFIITIRWAEK